MGHAQDTFLSIVALIVGVAALSVIVSPKAHTTQVIQATASGIANNLGVATAPVTGQTYNIDTSYPNTTTDSWGLPNTNFGAPQLFH